jgi:hypothetical protein
MYPHPLDGTSRATSIYLQAMILIQEVRHAEKRCPVRDDSTDTQLVLGKITKRDDWITSHMLKMWIMKDPRRKQQIQWLLDQYVEQSAWDDENLDVVDDAGELVWASMLQALRTAFPETRQYLLHQRAAQLAGQAELPV